MARPTSGISDEQGALCLLKKGYFLWQHGFVFPGKKLHSVAST